MRNLLVYFLLIATVFSACKKDDTHLFDKSPDQRLNEAIASYQTQLAGAQNGWKAFLYTKSGGIYTFYFKFNNSNRVQMLSSFDSTSAVTLKESSYRLKALQQPSLVFDTYSYLHVLADPDPSVNGGNLGAGLQSDFEFYFDSTSTDTINLVGRFNGSKVVLVRATQAEAAAFNSGQLANGLLLNKILTYYKRLTIGPASLDFYFDPISGTIKTTDNSGNLLDSSKITHYYLILNGIGLAKPLVIGNQRVSEINNLNFIPGTQTVTCTVNNVAATVTPVAVPQKVDITAPRRWWTSAATTGNYWFSGNGFHVNGVEDAFNINSLASNGNTYYYLIYWPGYAAGNDLFAPVFLNAARTGLTLLYGTAPRVPTFTSDGRAVFSRLGDYGAYPSTGPAAASRAQLYSGSGYYFVQTAADSYDMVSAADGKAWVSWTSTQ